MIIRRHKRFLKRFKKLSSSLQEKVYNVLEIFFVNPFDERLRNHSLQGSFEGLRSIDVTGDLRIIFKDCFDGSYEIVLLLNLGTHSQLYGYHPRTSPTPTSVSQYFFSFCSRLP